MPRERQCSYSCPMSLLPLARCRTRLKSRCRCAYLLLSWHVDQISVNGIMDYTVANAKSALLIRAMSRKERLRSRISRINSRYGSNRDREVTAAKSSRIPRDQATPAPIEPDVRRTPFGLGTNDDRTVTEHEPDSSIAQRASGNLSREA